MARKATAKATKEKKVEALTHDKVRRKNIPTAEHQSLAQRQEEMAPVGPIRYSRVYPLKAGTERARDKDVDPQIVWNGARIRLTKDQVRQLQEKGEIEIGDAQLVWRGKDQQDWSDLVVNAPPLYIQEKVHPKAIIDDLVRRSKEAKSDNDDTPDLFADFNGLDDPEARTEFYQHSQHWSNRMILGDSLQVMASLAEREHLRGQVQCIYFDPPYGIKFNSNWQVSTLSRDVKDGKQTDISREPEQVKAFRDTWKDGIHSYLTYLRDRLTVARDLLTESGSIFVQIGDENVHRVRGLMDEIFGEENRVALVFVKKTGGLGGSGLKSVGDYLVWYTRDSAKAKFRPLFQIKEVGKGETTGERYDQLQPPNLGTPRSMNKSERFDPAAVPAGWRPYQLDNLTSGAYRPNTTVNYRHEGEDYHPGMDSCWKTTPAGLDRLNIAGRIQRAGKTLRYKRFIDDFSAVEITNLWSDVAGAPDKIYVVQTSPAVIQRCILMTTDPGDLVLDPTCGSGATAFVAEHWGRRWITTDTSRVALALARQRLMSARFPYFFLADSVEGRAKQQDLSGKLQSDAPTRNDVRHGFVNGRAPHITLGSIARNSEIDVIGEEFRPTLSSLRAELNKAIEASWEEWEIPREADPKWPDDAKKLHAAWWEARIERQKKPPR